MERSFSPSIKARRLIVLFACSMALLLPHSVNAQSGTICAAAITMIPDTTIHTDSLQLNQEKWFSFTAQKADVRIVVRNLNKTQGYISSMQGMAGVCSFLFPVSDSVYESTALDSTVLMLTGLNQYATYYVKLRRGNPNHGGPGAFTISIKNTSPPPPAPCNCTTLFPTDSTNTCQAVCNGGFDLYNNATTFPLAIHGQIQRACPWEMPTISPNTTTPTTDLFNSYNSSSTYSVPSNFFGMQASATAPVNGRSGYIGINCFHTAGTNLREYAVVPLNYTLINGQQYIVSFKVSLADMSGYAVKNIGAYLTNGVPTQSNNTSFNLAPTSMHAYSASVITNDSGWTTISAVFTASGNMNYLSIGQMTTDVNATPTVHTPSATNPSVNQGAYYYIDDVQLVPYPDSISVTVTPSTICNGDTITLIGQTNVTNPYYWTWLGNPSAGAGFLDNNNDTVYAIPTDTVLYKSVIHLANYGGCTINDTATIHWNPGPTNCSAGADVSTCLGSSVTLTGSLGSPYGNYGTWTTLANMVLCTNCVSTTIIAPPSGDYIFISAYSSSPTACKDRDTVRVIGTPTAVQIVSPTGMATCDPNFIPFTTAGTYSTYSWSTNAASSNGATNDTLLALWSSNTIGTVSVTVTSANGCIGYGSVTAPSCCTTGAEEVLVNSYTTANPTIFVLSSGYYTATGRTFNINGDFHVNANTKIITSTVKFGPNAKIIIDPGYKLIITTSDLYACSSMWDGIYVDGTNGLSEIIVNNSSSIQDAKNAIVSTRNGKFTIDGTGGTVKLNKNNIGIWVKPYQGTHIGTIKKAIISCDSPTQPGGNTFTYAGTDCRSPISGTAYAAIYIDSCSDITIGDSAQNSYRNLMERQKYGIYSKNSNVKVWNNTFKYYQYNPTQNRNSPSEGVAVYAKGASTLNRTLTVGRVGNYKAHNLIQKCSYGVMAESYMNLNCEYNRIDSIKLIGVYALNNQAGKTILINRDSITEFTGTAINCTNVKNATVTITNNQLNETQSSSPSNFGYTGIYVANALNFSPTMLTIHTNTIKRIRNGVWVLNVTGAKVRDNNISFYPNQIVSVQSPAIGIKMEAAHSSRVHNNTISNTINGNPTSTLYDRMLGISITNCINDTVTKNTITKCGSGIFMKGSNNPSLIACNTLVRNYYGINFGYSNAVTTSVNISDQLRWGNPVTGTQTPTGNTWTPVTGGSDMKGKISPVRNWWCHATNVPGTSGMAFGSLTGIGNSAITLSSTTPDKCSVLLAQISPISADNMRDALLGEICKRPRTYDTLHTQYRYIDSVFAYRMLLENPSWTFLGHPDDSYYSAWKSAVASTNVGILAAVEDSIKAKQIAGVSDLLASLTPSGTPEGNRIAVISVYLDSWANDSMNLDSLQIVTLTAIANQAPVSGGTAVFDARAMLFLEVHDSSALRLAPILPIEEPQKRAAAYPNPTSGIFMVEWALEEGQTGTLELYDVSGRMIKSYILAPHNPIHQFDTKEVPAGLYFYILRIDTYAKMSERLIIIKE